MNQVKAGVSTPIKLKKRMGFGLVAAAAFFLFDPNISVIDLLPDAVGYIFLTLGLSQLSYMSDQIAEAYERFKKMILVSVAKLASLIVIFGLSDAANRPYMLLLFSFSFGVVELLFLIPAYAELFKGILTISDRQGGRVAYLSKRNGGSSYAERIHILTVVFVVFKIVSATWPEALSLLSTEYTESFVMYMYEYIGVFRILAFLPTLAFGIVWLVRFRGLFSRLGREEELVSNIKTTFENDLFPKTGMFIRRALNAVILALTVAAVFCVDLAMGSVGIVGDSAAEINIMPDWIAAVLILASAVMLNRYVERVNGVKISATVFLAVSLAASALKILFVSKFDYYTAINKLDDAYILHRVMCAVTAVENIAFVITVVFLVMMLKEIIRKYTGYTAYASAQGSERVTALQTELTGKLIYMIIFAVLSAISASLYEIFLPEKHVLAQYMWIIDLAVQSLFAGFTIRCLLAIKDEMENRFMLE